MSYEELISIVKDALVSRLGTVGDHNLDEKYIASAVRDYSEALRALETARATERKEH